MMNFTQYRARYDAECARLKEAFAQLSMAEKSRRVLGHDNPLLYSSQAVGSRLSATGLSEHALARNLERQTAQFEQIAYQTLVRAPLRRLPLPDTQWIFLDFTGQTGGWRYQRAEAVEKFRAAIAGKSPESSCRFLSGGIVTSEMLNRLMVEEFSRPGASFQTTAKQLTCRFQLWVARARSDIPRGACIRID
ncbi:MAG: hypothetical protein FJ147_09335 [Deltaproteobacteria bacterium]|nr:hypothetical protein [Deltaproteobacteria bacterium]